ncbi:flagellar filament capping protein FliD [Paenibacillus zanthoxyli]|uniref:flagellar filament capping protein FliD n=1 Tax=Paenibacillus zanthoxyli TaxID=369399 RepID=UPI00047127F6|nr:flagellar filament capping protein FliD [Paenibacillus zanthoxyli]
MVTRITGMASGMDIDSIVKKLMTAEKAPLDKMNQQKQVLEWKREGYREVSTKLVSFLQDKLQKLSLSASINAQKAVVTGNTDAITATASSATNGGVMDISVTNLATASKSVTDKATWTAQDGSTQLSALSIAVPSSVQIGGATISLDAGETIDSFVGKINASQTAGVTAIYDKTSGLSLTSKTTGATAITVDAGIASAFKLSSSLGKDAKLTVNGLEITKSSNTFQINGVDITLKTEGGASTHIEVQKDSDALIANVQSFVDAYNDVLSTLNNKIGEERYSKYAPLTTEQKADMKEDEITLWTNKAKSGMLKNDSILMDAVSNMRNAMIQGVDIGRVDGFGQPKPLSLAELGITTGTYETRGKLILDQDKLRAAIDNDPDIVSKFFGSQDAATKLTNNYTDKDGIIAKLKKIGNVSLQRLTETAGTSKVSTDLTAAFISNSTIGEQLYSLDTRISDMTDRLNRIETNYYKKFTAMETAINRYNSSSSSLSGMA